MLYCYALGMHNSNMKYRSGNIADMKWQYSKIKDTCQEIYWIIDYIIIKISKLHSIIIYILFLSSLEQRQDYGIGN